MTYSADFRAQVIKSVKDKNMNIRQACTFYDISKIPSEALLKDVARYPDDYMYERVQRLSCSKSGIDIALKRLGISQKKDLSASKSVPDKKSGV